MLNLDLLTISLLDNLIWPIMTFILSCLVFIKVRQLERGLRQAFSATLLFFIISQSYAPYVFAWRIDNMLQYRCFFWETKVGLLALNDYIILMLTFYEVLMFIKHYRRTPGAQFAVVLIGLIIVGVTVGLFRGVTLLYLGTDLRPIIIFLYALLASRSFKEPIKCLRVLLVASIPVLFYGALIMTAIQPGQAWSRYGWVIKYIDSGDKSIGMLMLVYGVIVILQTRYYSDHLLGIIFTIIGVFVIFGSISKQNIIEFPIILALFIIISVLSRQLYSIYYFRKIVAVLICGTIFALAFFYLLPLEQIFDQRTTFVTRQYQVSNVLKTMGDSFFTTLFGLGIGGAWYEYLQIPKDEGAWYGVEAESQWKIAIHVPILLDIKRYGLLGEVILLLLLIRFMFWIGSFLVKLQQQLSAGEVAISLIAIYYLMYLYIREPEPSAVVGWVVGSAYSIVEFKYRKMSLNRF